MLPELNFGTVVFALFVVAGILCIIVASANRKAGFGWVRIALRLLGVSLFAWGLLNLSLRHNALHLGRSAYGSAWVIDYTCGGASLALLVLLGWSQDVYRFFSPRRPEEEQNSVK